MPQAFTKYDLADVIAGLMACNTATEQDFFSLVVEKLNHRGYNLELHQRGIAGTYVCVVKTQA